MAVFCIPKHIAMKLKEVASRGEINLKDLYEMTSAQRNEFFQKYVNKETAQFINSGFEKAVLDEQGKTLETWVKNTFSIRDVPRKQNALDKISQLSQAGALNPDSAENFLSDLVAEKLGVSVTAEEAQKIDELSRGLEASFAKPVDEYGLPDMSYFENRAKMEAYLKSLTPSNQLKVFTSVIGRGSLLASVKSPLVNIIGNTVQQLETRLENRISSGQYSGRVDKKVMTGYMKRAMEIFNKTGFDVTRMNSFGDGMKVLGEDVVHSEGPGVVRKIGRFYEDIIFKKTLSAPDVYFSSMSFADSANLSATRQAQNEGLTGEALTKRATELFKNATSVTPSSIYGESIRQQAIADALVATFQDDTNYSTLALGIRNLFNKATGDLRIGDQIMPFVKTPANVVGMTLDAGGLGAVKAVYELPQAIRAFKEDDPTLLRKVAKNLTRAGLGMTIAFIISSIIKPDDFIGRYPTNRSEQELLDTKKAKENSIKIGNRWVSLDYFGFLGGPLVGFLYAKKYGKNLTSDIYSYASGVLIQSSKIPGFDAITQLSDNIKNLKPEEGEGIKDVVAKSKATAIDFLRSRAIPGIVYDIAKAMDISEREVDSKDPIAKVKSTIPGLRQTLPEKKDVFDAVIKGEPWWSVMLFGSRVQTNRDSKLINEITRLDNEGQIPNIIRPDKTGNSSMSNLKEQLGPERFADALSYFKTYYKNKVTRLIDSTSYKRKSAEDQKKEIDKIRQDAIDITLLKYHYKKPKK